MLTLLKYSTHECSICQAMAAYDGKVAHALGLDFVDVDLRSTDIYRRYRAALLQQHPMKQELRLPTYLLVEDPEGKPLVYGEISGGLPEELFRSRLKDIMRQRPKTSP